jgi:flagellar hook-associated protein FlgK
VRQTVLQRADAFTQALRQTSNSVSASSRDTEQQVYQTVDQVNQLVGELQGYNHLALQGNKDDPGLSSRVHAALEQLSSLADVQASFQSDGTVSLMLNGEARCAADKQYALSAPSIVRTSAPLNPDGHHPSRSDGAASPPPAA